jgi:hypothetical protein
MFQASNNVRHSILFEICGFVLPRMNVAYFVMTIGK